MAKKIRKPNSINKRKRQLQSFLIKDTAMIWVSSDKPDKGNHAYVQSWDLKANRLMVVNRDIMQSYLDVACKWQCYCAVFCRDQLGQQYVQGKWLVANEPYKQHQLADLFNTEHLKLIDESNQSHIINLGWVAINSNRSFNDSDAIKLMESRNCWAMLAPHEIKD